MSLTDLPNQKKTPTRKNYPAEHQLHSLFEQVPSAIVIFKGPDAVFELANKRALEIMGKSKEEIVGHKLEEALPELKDQGYIELIRKVYNSGEKFIAEEAPVSFINNGKTTDTFVKYIFQPLKDDDGNITGVMVIGDEVSTQVFARKKIEESEALLRKTKEQLELSIEAGKIGVWHWDVKKKQMTWSKEQLEIFGVDKEEFKGEADDFFKHVIEEDHEKIRMASGLEFERSENQYEFRIRRKDGQIRWIQSRSKTYMDESGNPQYITGINIDITEDVEAHEKIQKSEEENRLFIEYAPAAMAMFDKEMRYISVSKRWMREYDLTGNIIGQKHYELFPNILQRWKDVHSRCMLGDAERSDEDFYIKDDGSPVWLRWEVHPWYNGQNEIGGIVIFTENITGSKKAEQAIKENEERLHMAFESAHIGAWEYNPFTQKLHCSSESRKICGIPGDLDPDFNLMMKYIYPADQDYFIECIRNSLSHKSDGNFDMMIRFIRYDDQQLRWVNAKGKVFFNEDHLAQKLIGTMMDVTEEKNQQLALQESEERFRAMANEAPLFVWETDINLQTTYLNKAGLDYFNFDNPVNMSGLSWKKYIHPDDLKKVLNTMKEAAELHTSYTLEMRLRNGSTGEYHWFLDKGAPRYQNDQFTGFIGTSLDINERKEMEKALEEKVNERTRELAGQNILLRKQNDLVKKIFDSSVDALGVYDTELRIITLNQTSLQLIGGKEEDVIGKKLLEVVPQMKGTKGHKDLLSAINGKTIHNKVFYSEISNRYYENFLMPLKDENDKVYAVLVMAHDNTELITSAEKLKEAQQIAQIGHWDWDVSTGHLTWSDNLYSIYEVDPVQGISYEKFISLVHPDDRSIMQSHIQQALQTRTFSDFFHRIITPTGVEKIMHARGEVITDKKGEVKRMVGTGQDVTKQKLLEKQLIETSKRFEERNQFIEQLINSSLDLILVIDKDLRLITLNKKAQLLYKEYYKYDLIGAKVTEIKPPLKGTESYDDLLRAFAGDVIIKDKAKSTISDRYYEHNYVPLTNANGEVYAVMIISHDITESTRQMEELKKLYESDEQKNNFIAMASHELKTPITSIKGYVQLLLNAIEKEKEQQKPLPPLLVRSSLISVDKQIKRLTRLISELLDISKIETGTLELKRERFSFNELAIETVEDILYTNTRHEINLYHDFHTQIYGDKDRIGQVMINFLTNAIKYSPDSDKIEVTIHKVSDSEIGFSVRDFGIGIDKEEQKKIFERFYRAKGKAEQTYPGFGIGLFIANEFIQKHGGQVWVESEKGKGSTFTFTLPIHNQQ
jgi:PAS domain S-box-containing protein